jgi:hypothetical protein
VSANRAQGCHETRTPHDREASKQGVIYLLFQRPAGLLWTGDMKALETAMTGTLSFTSTWTPSANNLIEVVCIKPHGKGSGEEVSGVPLYLREGGEAIGREVGASCFRSALQLQSRGPVGG